MTGTRAFLPHIPALGHFYGVSAILVSVSELLSSADAAAALGVNQQRIRALIDAGQIPAIKVGRRWLIRSADLPHDRPSTRPMSARVAWATIGWLSGDLDAVAELLGPRERSRLQARMCDLLAPGPDHSVAAALSGWLRSRAEVSLFSAATGDAASLRADQRVILSGGCSPLSGMATSPAIEGYCLITDAAPLIADYVLVPAARDHANVVLRAVNEAAAGTLLTPRSPAPLGAVIADLCDSGARERGQAIRLLRDVLLRSGCQ